MELASDTCQGNFNVSSQKEFVQQMWRKHIQIQLSSQKNSDKLTRLHPSAGCKMYSVGASLRGDAVPSAGPYVFLYSFISPYHIIFENETKTTEISFTCFFHTRFFFYWTVYLTHIQVNISMSFKNSARLCRGMVSGSGKKRTKFLCFYLPKGVLYIICIVEVS